MKSLPKIKVSHESEEPLHIQLRQQLQALIESGYYLPGSRLPSENQLQRQLNISRNTIRQALREAELDGLIKRIPGKGTFVADQSANTNHHGQPMIGFITCEFDTEFEQLLLKGVESAAHQHHYQIVFSNSHHDPVEESRALDQLAENQVRGVVLWSHGPEYEAQHLRNRVENGFMPVVMMDRTLPDLPCDYIASDNYEAGCLAAQHLLALGHTQIVFLCHEGLNLLPVRDRLRGYQESLRALGITPPDPWIVLDEGTEMTSSRALALCEDLDHPTMQALTARFREDNGRPTAIFAVNDYMALVTLRAAQQAGLKIPDDLSIIGVDDAAFASHIEPPLTTIVQDTYTIGQRAVEFLLQRIMGYDGPPRREAIPVKLSARGTTSEPPGKQP